MAFFHIFFKPKLKGLSDVNFWRSSLNVKFWHFVRIAQNREFLQKKPYKKSLGFLNKTLIIKNRNERKKFLAITGVSEQSDVFECSVEW
jgi:hypothetical protein